MPRLRPIVAAWVRSLALSLARVFFTCPFTVSSVMDSSLATALLGVAVRYEAEDGQSSNSFRRRLLSRYPTHVRRYQALYSRFAQGGTHG